MKPLPETTQALVYFGLLTAGVVLLVFAVWDFSANEQRLQVPILWSLAGLCVGALGTLAYSYLIRQTTSQPAATYTPPPQKASTLEPPPAPAPSPAPAPKPAPLPPLPAAPPLSRTVVVGAATGSQSPPELPRPDDRPEQIPGPLDVPSRRFGDVESLPFEVGDPTYAGTAPESHHGQHPFRILCDACGAFFTLFTGRARPVKIHCVDCNKELGLSGTLNRRAPHVWVRCKLCGQYQPVLQDTRVAAYLCPTCGQRNTTHDLPSGTPVSSEGPAD